MSDNESSVPKQDKNVKKFFPRKRRSDSAKKNSDRRMVEHRIAKGTKLMEERRQRIREQLHYGEDFSAILPRIEEVETKKPVILSISTRQIGFGLMTTLAKSRNFSNINYIADCYMMYRVFLAVLEAKLANLPRTYHLPSRFLSSITPYYSDATLLHVASSVTVAPAPIKFVLDQIGILKLADVTYYPAIAKEVADIQGNVVPRAENIAYSTLERTITILSDPASPVAYRQDFRAHSPLPGATWNDQDVLTNPQDFWPRGYDTNALRRDISFVTDTLSAIQKQVPKLVSGAVQIGNPGQRAMMMSNDLETLKQVERRPNEPLLEYYSRGLPEGNITSYWTWTSLTAAERLTGQLCLLGEQTPIKSARDPIYVMRNPAVSHTHYSSDYYAAAQIVYG